MTPNANQPANHEPVDECDTKPFDDEPAHQQPAEPGYTTVDGVTVTAGLTVFTSDARWGTVTRVAVWPADRDPSDAWHEVTYDDGHVNRYNRERLTTRKPW